MAKKVLTRVKNKHDIEANWLLATNFIPFEGEIIIYDPDETYPYPRFKVGNGQDLINNLPFSPCLTAEEATDLITTSSDDLFNRIQPIGSILVTTTNSNPGNILGGTWELIDKAFKDNYLTANSSYWTSDLATLGEYSNILLNDHTIALRLNFTTNSEITDDTATLGQLTLNSCGINENGLSYAVFYGVAISDKGNCTLCYRINQDGSISIHDILNVDGTHKMASGSDFFIHITLPVKHTNMLDAFCDKFYWKRIA